MPASSHGTEGNRGHFQGCHRGRQAPLQRKSGPDRVFNAEHSRHTGGMSGLNVVLAGAAIGNGNKGVEALGRAVADALDRDGARNALTVLDNGWGIRTDTSSRYQRTAIEFAGVRLSRRWYRSESWAQVRLSQRMGARGNPVARRFARSDAVLDLSAGDSFTDLYGPTRLRSVSEPKFAALRARSPLVLLPQTYGPFETAAGRQLAERLVRSSAVAYARDEWSYERLLEIAGPQIERSRLRSGVDVAFALEPRRPPEPVVDMMLQLNGEVLAGVNVSGLLRTPESAKRFGLAGDYVATMSGLVKRLIAAGTYVVFVPHVHLSGGIGESDVGAIALVLESLTDAERSRAILLPPELDAAEAKWCIERLDWLVGSRMHATIGALSSSVPAYSYAYSDKARGVFETCGMGDQVGDARSITGEDAIDLMVSSFESRTATALALKSAIPPVIARSRNQLQDVLDDIRRWREAPDTIGAIG